MNNYEYYTKADLSKYQGKWVAIYNNNVIAFGNSFKEVAKKVDKQFPGIKPLFARVPEQVIHVL
ncbi:MAG: hypothetical protein J7L44_02260 [Candidatus Diapherotrites archaeon]|nr:hypothetical protein [Candidatus Diapherotrites archaeon]